MKESRVSIRGIIDAYHDSQMDGPTSDLSQYAKSNRDRIRKILSGNNDIESDEFREDDEYEEF